MGELQSFCEAHLPQVLAQGSYLEAALGMATMHSTQGTQLLRRAPPSRMCISASPSSSLCRPSLHAWQLLTCVWSGSIMLHMPIEILLLPLVLSLASKRRGR